MTNKPTVDDKKRQGSRKTAIIIALLSMVALLGALLAFIHYLTSRDDMITLHTNMGNIVIQLNPEQAPISSTNFKQYCDDGFYDGLIFHRIINNFMVQGGGMDSDMNERKTREPIQNEADNGLLNVVGSVAMARTSDPHSATAQFFINVKDNDFLNHRSKDMQGWGYAVFAQVVEGMDVVNKIKQVKTGNSGHHSDVPVEQIVIEKTSC